MIRHWFNTGVRQDTYPPVPLMEHQYWHGGVKQVAFYLESEPPEGYVLKYLFDYPELIKEGEVAIRVVGGGMLSKFAVYGKGHL